MKSQLSKNDFFTQKARDENYPARSVYKLQEIDKKFKIFKKSDRVLDLGASPGSWLLYIGQRVSKIGKVVGCDVLDLNIKPFNNTIFIKKNVLANDFFESDFLKNKYNVVVSDMAPNTTGILEVDVANCLELSNRALEIAKKVLLNNGDFVCKVFEGQGIDNFIKEVKQNFETVKRFRPQAVRRGSKEFYLVAKNFLPNS